MDKAKDTEIDLNRYLPTRETEKRTPNQVKEDEIIYLLHFLFPQRESKMERKKMLANVIINVRKYNFPF